MAFLGKTYTMTSQENFDTFLKTSGVSDAGVEAMVKQKSTLKIVKSGDSYVITQSGIKGDRDITFKSGVEFEDTIGADDTPIKTTFTVDGNTINQVIITAAGTAHFKREFNGDDLVVTITSDKMDGVAKRYYKA